MPKTPREEMCIDRQDVDMLNSRMSALETDTTEIKAAIERLCVETQDLVEILKAMKGAFKVLNWIAKLAKPFAMIGASFLAASAFWSWIKAGLPPPGD